MHGKTELLLGMNIVRKLDIAVSLGGDQFKVGQGEWDMMTFKEKKHCVFPPAPTSCAYTKLNEYFGKLQNSELGVLKTQGGFGEIRLFGQLLGRKINER